MLRGICSTPQHQSVESIRTEANGTLHGMSLLRFVNRGNLGGETRNISRDVGFAGRLGSTMDSSCAEDHTIDFMCQLYRKQIRSGPWPTLQSRKECCFPPTFYMYAGRTHTIMHPLLNIYFFIITFLSYSQGSPLPLSEDGRLEARKAVDCNSLNAKFDLSCWEILGVSDFLHKWIDDHKCKDGTISTREVVSSGCCDKDDPWSSCFLRLEKGERGYDCTNVNPQLCSWDARQIDTTGPDAARKSYVLRGIYSM